MAYFAVKYEIFSDLGGPLSIMQIIWIFLCSRPILRSQGNFIAGGTWNSRKKCFPIMQWDTLIMSFCHCIYVSIFSYLSRKTSWCHFLKQSLRMHARTHTQCIPVTEPACIDQSVLSALIFSTAMLLQFVKCDQFRASWSQIKAARRHFRITDAGVG